MVQIDVFFFDWSNSLEMIESFVIHVDYLWGIMDLNRTGLEPDWWIILVKLLGIRYNNFYEIIINNAITCMRYRYNLW